MRQPDCLVYDTLAGEPGDAFLCVSALTPYKRLDVAVDAFTRLGWPLVVIGSGGEARRLRERAGPTVRFLGWQDDEALRDAYAHCRAFVFPGEEEFGIAPLEAMAAGRPVIAYGHGALIETCVDGVTGLLVEPDDVPALATAIRRLITNPAERNTMGTRARELSRDRYHPDVVARQTLEAYQSVLEGQT